MTFFRIAFINLLIILTLFLTSCNEQGNETIAVSTEEALLNLPEVPYDYTSIELPDHLTTNFLIGASQSAAIDNDNTPADNPVTNEGATLGRVLFYDISLSKNGSISCASCHKQDKGFSDDARLSLGFEGGTTRRHSMSLINAAWYDRGRFFWDERAATLEEQVLEPFQDPVEMGLTLEELINIVASKSYYPPLFESAFGSTEITDDKIAKALAQFVRSIISVNSKYDVARAEANRQIDDFPQFTLSENNGKRLFFLPTEQGGGGCVGCHFTEAFINPDNGTTNNGLDAESTDDLGVFEVFGQPVFLGTFKVPSLKSIALTAPYMHDGRFATLEEVVEHYNSGVQNHPNLAGALRDINTGQPKRLNFTEQEKADLVNFLETLTDEQISIDEKFSNPFVR